MLDKPGGGHYNISVAMRQYEPLAQPAEHLTFNQRARGSNPRWFTKRKRRLWASFSFGEPLPMLRTLHHMEKLPRGGAFWVGRMILFFAGEDGHAKGGDGHEGRGRGDHIIGAGGGVLLGLGLGGVPGGGDDDDLSGGGLAPRFARARPY